MWRSFVKKIKIRALISLAICAAKKLNTSLNDLAVKKKKGFLTCILVHDLLLYYVPWTQRLTYFTIEIIKKYGAALLTRCYTQHALRPFIDSESNHIRNFIKITFINKVIDYIDLPSIFQDKSVTQSIPTYFQNSKLPIICYKYNKPIRNTIFQ